MAAVATLVLAAASTPALLPLLAVGSRQPAPDTERAGTPPTQAAPGANVPAQPAASAITFLDSASTVLVVNESKLSGTLLVSNTTSSVCDPAARAAEPNVELRILLRSSKWKPVPAVAPLRLCVPSGVSLVPFEATVTATLPNYPLTGVLVMQAGSRDATNDAWTPIKGAKPVSLNVSGIAREDSPPVDWELLQTAGIVAFVGVLAAGVALAIRLGTAALSTRMGSPGSSLADGWSAALIVGGPLLTTAFALGGFPDYPATMTKKAYLVLSFVISIIIGVAPNIYGLYRAPTQVTDLAGKLTIQNQGIAGMFLASAWFTLTGCLAQLALLQLFFRDIRAASLVSAPAGVAIDRLLYVLWFAMAIYGPTAIFSTIISQHKLQTAVPPRAGPLSSGVSQPTERLPDWTVL